MVHQRFSHHASFSLASSCYTFLLTNMQVWLPIHPKQVNHYQIIKKIELKPANEM